MSKNFYLLFITMMFFSCSNYLPYLAGNQTKSITDIPLKQSVNNIDCFFNNQTPAKPFYKVNIVEVTGAANASYDELIICLKNKALQQGLDAVMILDKQQEIAYENLNENIIVKDTSVNYYRQLATPYQKLSGVGIKYAENVNYLDSIVKSTTFECSDSRINGTINFDFYGNPLIAANRALGNFYADSIETFDISRHQHSCVKGWQYKMNEILTEEVVAFKKESDGMDFITAKIDDNDANKFNYKVIVAVMAAPKKFTLKIERDLAGRITKKTLYQKKNIVWVEETYYNKNITTGFKRYRISNNKQEIIFTATNQFYRVNDLPKPIGN